MASHSSSVKNLCRVCSSKGLIPIDSCFDVDILIKAKKSLKKTSVREMIRGICGDLVTTKDELARESPEFLDSDLPQFICTTCLFYLNHAWELRQTIISNSLSLKAAIKLVGAKDQSLEVMARCESSNQREIRLEEDDTQEEKRKYHLRGTIKNVELTYNLNRLKGVNCPGCQMRYMEDDLYRKHIDQCVILKINKLFLELKKLTGLRQGSKIDNTEFILKATDAVRVILPVAEKIKFKKPEKLAKNEESKKKIPDQEAAKEIPGTQQKEQNKNPTATEEPTKMFQINNNGPITNQTINFHFDDYVYRSRKAKDTSSANEKSSTVWSSRRKNYQVDTSTDYKQTLGHN